MRNKSITYFLLFVMTIQVLPVMEMGKALYNSSFTEELAHDVELEKEVSGKENFKQVEFVSIATPFMHFNIELQTAQYIQYATVIPHNHGADIHVPPPNC